MTNRGATAGIVNNERRKSEQYNILTNRGSTKQTGMMKMIKEKITVGVPCPATEMMTRAMKASEEMAQTMQRFIDGIGGRSITPEEDEILHVLLEKSNIVKEQRSIAYQEQLVTGMKEVCDKIMRKYGQTTDEEDARMCREGQALINMAIRANEKINSNRLMNWIDQTDGIMSRCRWIGCKPEGTKSVGVPCAATGRRNYHKSE